jgi:MoxR-like ATPase
VSHLFDAVLEILSQKFVDPEKFAYEVTVSLLTDYSTLWYGEGGFGKSEMILEIMKFLPYSHGVIECHADMAVSDLFGGSVAKTTRKFLREDLIESLLDPDITEREFRKLSQLVQLGGTEEITEESYNWEQGFHEKEVLFFEEMLDMPPRISVALKSGMTQKFCMGRKVKNKFILAATNRDPMEVMESLPEDFQSAFDALLQRFLMVAHQPPIQTENYHSLFYHKKRYSRNIDPISLELIEQSKKECQQVSWESDIAKNMLFALSAENEVSYREFLWAKKLMRVAAYLRNSSTIEMEDFSILYLLGTTFDLEDTTEKLKQIEEQIKAKQKSSQYVTQMDWLESLLTKQQTLIRENLHFYYLNIKKTAEILLDRCSQDTGIPADKDKLLSRAQWLVNTAAKRAGESVHYKNLLDEEN